MSYYLYNTNFGIVYNISLRPLFFFIHYFCKLSWNDNDHEFLIKMCARVKHEDHNKTVMIV